MNVAGLHAIASAAFERMVYSLVEGLLLTFAVALALRLVPTKASQTRFAIWLSALAGIVAVTVFGLRGAAASGEVSSPPLFTLPISFALGAFSLWIVLATVGLIRILIGLWQLWVLRKQCEPVDLKCLPADARELAESFQKVRRVSLLRSGDSQTPKAIGFIHAAIILPAWLMDEGTPEQLKHVLLHELAHLRRRDDWTNLFQQVVKALLFFHPAIWWMERELSLSREQACDDAALEQTSDARDYARSLAVVAEKSFLRRQIALAQAVVDRAHQLTQRVTRILDPKRPARNQVWKPAVPLVAVAAAVCGFSTSWTPALVKIQDAPVMSASAHAVQNTSGSLAAKSMQASEPAAVFGVKAWQANAKFDPRAIQPVSTALNNSGRRSSRMNEKVGVGSSLASTSVNARKEHSPMIVAINTHGHSALPVERGTVNAGVFSGEEANGLVVLVATQQTITAGPYGWRVEVSEVRWVVPAKAIHKPVPPRKT